MAIAQSVWSGHRFAKERGEESLDTSGLLSCPMLPGQQTEWPGLVPGHEKEKRRDVNILSKKVTRRSLLRLFGAGTAAGLLAACQPKVVEKVVKETVVVEKEVKASDIVMVEYWTPWSPTHEPVLTAMAEECEKRHPHMKVHLVVGGPGGGDYNEILLARIAAGNPPDMTTLWAGPPALGVRGALLPIDDYMDTAEVATHDAFFEGGLKTCQFRGKTYGLPRLGWLKSATWSKPALILMSLWGIGGSALIFLGGLKEIPRVLYEAAEIDGANRVQRLWHVTLPLLTPVIFFNLIMGIIGSFQVFTVAFIAGGTTGGGTGGGGTAGGPLGSMLMYMLLLFRNAFRYFHMGYASAMAIVLFLIILVITLALVKTSGGWVYYEAAQRT